MPRKKTIQNLLNQTGPADLSGECIADLERKLARVRWVKETTAKLRKAHRQRDARCDEAVARRLSDEAFSQLLQAEEAKVQATYAELKAVVDNDQWPAHLHFSGL